MNRLPFLICFLFLALTACHSSRNTSNKQLLDSYRTQIGCSKYGTLRLAEGNHDPILKKVLEDHSKFEPAENLSTAIVYRGLNKDILFIHLVYRSTKESRKTVNYIFDKDDDEIVGSYQCFQ